MSVGLAWAVRLWAAMAVNVTASMVARMRGGSRVEAGGCTGVGADSSEPPDGHAGVSALQSFETAEGRRGAEDAEKNEGSSLRAGPSLRSGRQIFYRDGFTPSSSS